MRKRMCLSAVTGNRRFRTGVHKQESKKLLSTVAFSAVNVSRAEAMCDNLGQSS